MYKTFGIFLPFIEVSIFDELRLSLFFHEFLYSNEHVEETVGFEQLSKSQSQRSALTMVIYSCLNVTKGR